MTLENQIKQDLPNFPKSVVDVWLLPFAKELGWPPKQNTRWEGILDNQIDLAYWQSKQFIKKKIIHCEPLHDDSIHKVQSMNEAYLGGKKNLYGYKLGPGGKERYIEALKYLKQNGRFPKSLIFRIRDKKYEILDGHHRYLAYRMLMFTLDEIKSANEAEKLDALSLGYDPQIIRKLTQEKVFVLI